MGFSGSQDKDNMWWWFLQGLEQGVGGFFSEHMDFIYNINLVAGLIWSIVDPLPEVSDFINTPIAGGINLNDIQGSTLSYCLANTASIARFTLAISKTIHRLSQNTSGGGLTGSSWTTKKVGMRYTTATQGIE